MLNESLKNLSSFHKDILKRLVRFKMYENFIQR